MKIEVKATKAYVITLNENEKHYLLTVINAAQDAYENEPFDSDPGMADDIDAFIEGLRHELTD